MKNIKIDIKKVVSENLQKTRKQRFDESFKNAHESKNYEEFLNHVLIASSNLISEGYSIEDVDGYINEQNVAATADNALDKVKNADWGKIARGSIMSMVKEYAIKWLLTNVGLNKHFSETAAIFFADYDPLDLLKPFKDPQNCAAYMPKMSKSLMEAIARELGGNITGTSNTLTMAVGNIFGESIGQSNLPKIVGDKFCKMIHG
jgi:hypothetical protein